MIVFSEPDAPPQVCNVYREYEKRSQQTVRVRLMRSDAHPQGVFVYRIEMDDRKLVVATDTEGYTGGDRRLIQFARGADLLIHDAEFTAEEYLDGNPARQGWGHSTWWEMAVEVAQAAGAKKLALTHHNAHHDDAFLEDMERQAQALFPAAIVAREGLTLNVKGEKGGKKNGCFYCC
jgi:ribonuclease BN (tRNA processing enzyme)